ncbi:MAG: hypothetical protein ACOCRO_04470 [Halanaerobiales bacterium]
MSNIQIPLQEIDVEELIKLKHKELIDYSGMYIGYIDDVGIVEQKNGEFYINIHITDCQKENQTFSADIKLDKIDLEVVMDLYASILKRSGF